jgi:hypothetical protein
MAEQTNPTTDSAPERGPFSTLEQARQADPHDERLRIFTVTSPDGRVSFWWADGAGTAVQRAARHDGYKARTAGKAPSRDELAAQLAVLSAEDRAALLAALAELGGTPAAPAPTAPTAPAAPPEAARQPGKKGGNK